MEVTHGTPDGGSLSAINGNWVLTLDAATGRFARRFTFALATGGLWCVVALIGRAAAAANPQLFDFAVISAVLFGPLCVIASAVWRNRMSEDAPRSTSVGQRIASQCGDRSTSFSSP